jgi:hypothetical protein
VSEREVGRTFTVEEANGLLPELRARLERIRAARQVVIQAGERVREAVAADGGGTEGSAYFEALRTLRVEVERFAEEGILLRDAERGVVDFPAEIDGREGFLCWRADEDAVSHWHPPQTGFAGRRPL